MTTKSPRSRKTKTEVQQEFLNIVKENEEAKSSTSSKDNLANQIKEAEIANAVSGLSVEVIIQKFSGLSIEISKTLSNLSEKMVTEVELLHNVRNAIALENTQLQKIHKVDIAATSLDDLIEEYKQKKDQLEAEIDLMRNEWEKEKNTQLLEAKEYDANVKKTRQREGEDYDYKRNQERKKSQDKFEEEVRLLEKENTEKQEALEKSWLSREEFLKTQENRLQELQKNVELFPARLKEEVEKARSQGIEESERKLSQEILILKKDRDTDQRIAQMKIQSLEEMNNKLQLQVTQLQKQQEETNKEIKEIAEKAIEGASGARALSHVNQIAIEQAKNRSNQG